MLKWQPYLIPDLIGAIVRLIFPLVGSHIVTLEHGKGGNLFGLVLEVGP